MFNRGGDRRATEWAATRTSRWTTATTREPIAYSADWGSRAHLQVGPPCTIGPEEVEGRRALKQVLTCLLAKTRSRASRSSSSLSIRCTAEEASADKSPASPCFGPKRIEVLTLLTGLGDTLSVVRVDDEDDTLGVLEVCRGKRWSAWSSFDPLHHSLRVDGM